jgi:hypothetical protein
MAIQRLRPPGRIAAGAGIAAAAKHPIAKIPIAKRAESLLPEDSGRGGFVIMIYRRPKMRSSAAARGDE